jgi:ADP-ribose pyrophosphatase YjhB (NUDIX family)
VPGHETVEQPVCQGCGFVLYLDPKVAAGTIPVLGHKIVLLRRALEPARGLWVYPCGYVNRGEHLEAAAERETEEEVGLRVDAGELVGIYSYTDTPIVVVVYETAALEGALCPGYEAQEVGTFAPAELPWKTLAFPSTRDALVDWALKYAPECVPPEAVPFSEQPR